MKKKKSKTEAGNSSCAPESARRRTVGAAQCLGLLQVCPDDIFEFFESRQVTRNLARKRQKWLPRRVIFVHRILLNIEKSLAKYDAKSDC